MMKKISFVYFVGAVLAVLSQQSAWAESNERADQPKASQASHRYDGGDYQATGDFWQYSITSLDGVQRPFVVYRPKSARLPGSPLLIYLHGAISRPDISPDPLASASKNQILRLADQGGYQVLFPYGQAGATWFDAVGESMVIDELTWAKEHLDIDPDRVFLAGFSDGGSGTFYLAHHHADKFAGFIAFNGSLPVAAFLGEKPIYPKNLNHKPFFIVNTTDDILYPAVSMQPVADFFGQQTPTIYHTPAGGHDTAYLPDLLDKLQVFIDGTTKTRPKDISLEVSEVTGGAYEWLTIDELDLQDDAKDWHKPYRLSLTHDKASFGMSADPSRQDGFYVASIKANSTAQSLGVQVGDKILKVGDLDLDNPYVTYQYLATKRAGDLTELTVFRNGETLVLSGHFQPPYQYQVFKNTQPSAKIQASFDGRAIHVQTSRVKRFTIDFNRLGVLPSTRLDVVINGVARSVVATDKQTFVLP